MLTILRQNAKQIIIATVSLFILSLLGLGAYSFLNRSPNNTKEEAPQSRIGLVNGQPVDEARFAQQFNQYIASVPQAQRILLDPDLIDYYRYEAFRNVVDFMLMLNAAEAKGIKALPQEINYRIDQIVQAYELKSKRDLKKLLTSNKISWKDFKHQQKDEVIVAKFHNGITSKVKVTPEDRKIAFTEIKARHILIEIPESQTTSNLDEDLKALKKAESIYEMVLANRKRFPEIAKRYSDDELTAENGGDLGWVGRGQMVENFEKQLFELQPGEIAGPIKTIYGYHIIQAIDRREKEIPEGVTEEQIEAQLLQQKQREASQEWLIPVRETASINIIDPALKAYEYRTNKQYDEALLEYHQILSNNPNNLLTYIQISRMLEKLGRTEQAEETIKKALIWQKYNQQYQYPILYFSASDFYLKHKQFDKMSQLIDMMLELFPKHELILMAIQQNYGPYLSVKQKHLIETHLSEIEAEKKQQQEQQQSELSPLELGPPINTQPQ